ncbi:unnamed protein product [Fraxinus pennsylvanica]|uniref:Serine acetyltransferase N-terminal domain-containing protein n=1 Tax=Fraxinus pennsylvanica TaxID=56036 RepID=A0AAD2A0G6_9LAMI|nr:unnamed protein product [Fraxinus pennsylvanica]
MFSDLVSCVPISEIKSNTLYILPVFDEIGGGEDVQEDYLWQQMKAEARRDIDQEPIFYYHYFCSILTHDSMESALANHLSMKLSDSSLPSGTLYDLFVGMVDEAIMFFGKLVSCGITPCMKCITSLLLACSALTALSCGKEIHSYVVRTDTYRDEFVATALIDMYINVGNLRRQTVFSISSAQSLMIQHFGML